MNQKIEVGTQSNEKGSLVETIEVKYNFHKKKIILIEFHAKQLLFLSPLKISLYPLSRFIVRYTSSLQ